MARPSKKETGNASHLGFEATLWTTAYKLRGIEGDLGDEPADSFHRDLHRDLKADYILANPPFNMSDWLRHGRRACRRRTVESNT